MVGRRSIFCIAFLAVFPLPSSLYFPLFISVTGALFAGAWELMAGFGAVSILELPANYKWKLQDVSGTQPPLSDAVVNNY